MSDLASDSEDMFFMQASEADDYQRRKGMQRWEAQRLARIAALDSQEKSSEEEGADGDEPTAEQLDLMKRTAGALRGATNAAMLEMKILANHGADPRFSFLRRGKEQRWGQVWERLKSGESEQTGGAEQQQSGHTASILVNYGSDSSTEAGEGEEEAARAKKKRRLDLAREWSRKRAQGQRDGDAAAASSLG